MSKRSDIDLYLIHHKHINKCKCVSNESISNIIIPKMPIIGENSLAKIDLDIIHFNYIPWEYRSFFHILKPKKIATSHISIGYSGKNYSEKHNFVRRIVEPLNAKFLDKIIAVSSDLKTRLAKYLRISTSKIEVVYEGVDHEIFKPVENKKLLERTSTKYEIKMPFIIHTSNFSMRKNPRILFETFRSLANEGYQGELLIVGSGWRNKVSENLIADSPINKKIKFLGYIPTQDLVHLYNLAEIAFFPSLHENFCFPIVEAMACGTPVVSSKVYSIPEITSDAAVLCNPYSSRSFTVAIQSILNNRQQRNLMTRRGLENSKRFSWQKCIQNTIKVYEKVLNN